MTFHSNNSFFIYKCHFSKANFNYRENMFGLKKKYPTSSQSSSQDEVLPCSVEAHSPKILCYTEVSKAGNTYFIYWKTESLILGVSDLDDNVFEIMLGRKERKAILKNVA